MTHPADPSALYDAIEMTWPAADMRRDGAWMLRDGAGGGKRVSAATADAAVTPSDLAGLEAGMRALGQLPLVMVRAGQERLDAVLAGAGYALVDPVNMYAVAVKTLTVDRPPRLSAFDLWEPLAIQRDIWAAGGIGPSRIDVMARVAGPKTALFGRHDGRAAAAGFVAMHRTVAMVHALEVLAEHRRQGVGRNLTLHAAHWASGQGADTLAVLCTRANAGANALYTSMGFALVGEYHYRMAKEETP